MQPLGDMKFYHVITWQIKNIILQHNIITKLGWNTCYMSRDLLYVIYYIPLRHLYVIHVM